MYIYTVYQIACSAAEVVERYSTQTPEAAQIVPYLPVPSPALYVFGQAQAASRGDWFVTSELRRINGCSKQKAWLGLPPKQETSTQNLLQNDQNVPGKQP